jgi:hypothetical protein
MIVFQVDFLWYPLGSEEVVHSLFSTISYNLEPNGWGTKFPILMHNLYSGRVEIADINKAQDEYNIIKEHIKNIPTRSVVFDISDVTLEDTYLVDNRSRKNVYEYFQIDKNASFIDALGKAIERAIELNQPLRLKHISEND